MRLPRLHLPSSVWLFLAGMFVGSFFTLKFMQKPMTALPVSPRGGVLGESVAEEQGELEEAGAEKAEKKEEDAVRAVSIAARTPVQEGIVRIMRVVDGDTVELAGGARVRYIGIDAPEAGSQGRDGCLAAAAQAANASLVAGKEAALKMDVSDTDRYGRSLRYVHADGVFVNEALVEQGFARAHAYPPDTKYEAVFAEAEARAKAGRLGMWGPLCGADAPGREIPFRDPDTLPGTCDIKGNISAAGERIYHLPGCRSYEKTVINTVDGERWFCSAKEAEGAGWRKAKDC